MCLGKGYIAPAVLLICLPSTKKGNIQTPSPQPSRDDPGTEYQTSQLVFFSLRPAGEGSLAFFLGVWLLWDFFLLVQLELGASSDQGYSVGSQSGGGNCGGWLGRKKRNPFFVLLLRSTPTDSVSLFLSPFSPLFSVSTALLALASARELEIEAGRLLFFRNSHKKK